MLLVLVRVSWVVLFVCIEGVFWNMEWSWDLIWFMCEVVLMIVLLSVFNVLLSVDWDWF